MHGVRRGSRQRLSDIRAVLSETGHYRTQPCLHATVAIGTSDLDRHTVMCARALTQRAKPLILNCSGIRILVHHGRGAGFAGSRLLPRQMLRRSLLSLVIYALSSRVHCRRSRSYEYHGLVHRAGALFDEAEFTGDENAIVDFKYSASPRITWWFDHHLSAFLTPQDQAHFRACQQDPACAMRKFFDPTYTPAPASWATSRATKFGFDTAPVADLIHWANIVDGALYESPESAVEMAAPGHEAHAGDRVYAGPRVHSAPDSAAHRDAAGRSAGAAVCGRAAAAAAGAPQAGI